MILFTRAVLQGRQEVFSDLLENIYRLQKLCQLSAGTEKERASIQ
jgi:hypothetical protein